MLAISCMDELSCRERYCMVYVWSTPNHPNMHSGSDMYVNWFAIGNETEHTVYQVLADQQWD